MHYHQRPEWFLPESAAVPEAVFHATRRRDFLRSLGVAAAGLALLGREAQAATGGFPSKENSAYPVGALKLTPYEIVTSYNNFYEFGQGKDEPVVAANRGWKTEPWTVELAGLVKSPGSFEINELIKKLGGIEQRVYRHRCVEAWSMVVPWDGFPLAKLVELVEPLPEATHVKFTSFLDPKSAPGQRSGSIPWPYVEGLRLDEARHELAFIATGLYGKPLPNQNGAPLRLVVPWKYGFKGAKSIVKIEFTKREPLNTWQQLAPSEYGFYANVNPQVDHPRWSQASEKVIGGSFFSGKQPTLMFNGYEKQVAALYKGLDLRKFY